MKKEIDKFHFEEEKLGAFIVSISDAEDDIDRHSGVHFPTLVIARLDSSTEEEEEEMALNKGNKSLRELMVARNKGTTSQENPKSQVPTTLPPLLPTIPADLGQKPIPDLKKKRPVEVPEEGEVGPQKETKQQKVAKDAHDKSSQSVESREEKNRADVHITQCTWSLRLEVDGTPIP